MSKYFENVIALRIIDWIRLNVQIYFMTIPFDEIRLDGEFFEIGYFSDTPTSIISC